MEVDQEAQPASSAALPAETPKEEKESELSGKEEEKKDKAEESDSDLSSIGDDISAEAEDQDTDEERDVAQRLVKHRSVNAGQEKVPCKDGKQSLSQQAKQPLPSLCPNYRMKGWRVKNSLRMIRK